MSPLHELDVGGRKLRSWGDDVLFCRRELSYLLGEQRNVLINAMKRADIEPAVSQVRPPQVLETHLYKVSQIPSILLALQKTTRRPGDNTHYYPWTLGINFNASEFTVETPNGRILRFVREND